MPPIASRFWQFISTLVVSVADPGGAGVLAQGVFVWKAPVDCTIKAIKHVPLAAWVAAAAANDGVVVVKNSTLAVTIATLSVVTNLAANSVNDMGALTNAAVRAGDVITIDIGAALGAGTANGPASALQIDYQPTDA